MARAVTPSWPWGRPMSWAEAREGERRISLNAGQDELVRIARDLGVEALLELRADLTTRGWLDGVEIDGRVRGRAVRICGVTLDPFEEEIDEPIRLRVVPEGSENAPRAPVREMVIDPEADDPPEAAGAAIDLCAYVVEAFALGLDPFPRKPGAVFMPPETPAADSPFSALAHLARPPARER